MAEAAASPAPGHRSRWPNPNAGAGLSFNSAGMPMWAKLTALLGFPIVACGALALAVWQTAGWTADNVVKPAMTSHIATLEKITETQTRLTDSFGTLTTTIQDMAADSREQRDVLKEISTQQRDLHKALKERLASDSGK